MSNDHLIPRNIGNLRGFSTSSSFIRPPNVAEKALNIQRSPQNTLQLRRGYQCQIGITGGMGLGTFDNPDSDNVDTVTVGIDGFLYSKLQKQIFLKYNGKITGTITNVTNPSADLTQITSIGHGLIDGAQILISGVVGAFELNNPNFYFNINFYTITVVDVDNFILDGIAFSSLSAYVSGGIWSINFADGRYLTLSIFTDIRFIDSVANQSITCNIIINRAAQIDGNQNNVNTINVQFGQSFFATNVVQFYTSSGVFEQRNIVSTTPTSITIDGSPVSVLNNVYINQLVEVIFGKGFDVVSPILISDFIATITDPSNGVPGLLVDINGDSNVPAAFIQIIEPVIIPINNIFTLDYWYWEKINFTINPPLPGSANTVYQNSQDFENASMAVFDDVIYIANGWDFPQKYDGQTIYRTGMPIGVRPSEADQTTALSMPFLDMEVYEYAIAYEQVDARGHIVEGEISAVQSHTVGTTPSAIDVTVTNLMTTLGNNWNTDCALAIAGTALSYGPDVNGFYYDTVPVTPGYTLMIGDTAYYADQTAAVMTGPAVPTTNTVTVAPGHCVLPGNTIYFYDTTTTLTVQRVVELTTSNSITFLGPPVSVDPGSNPNIMCYKTSLVYGNVAIVDGDQINPPTNIINVKTAYPVAPGTGVQTIEANDIVEFIDANNNLQRRNVISVTATTVEIDGNPVTINDLFLIYSINQDSDAVTFQRFNANGVTFTDHAAATDPYGSLVISNNLRINIYRTFKNTSFGVNGELFLVAAIPNNSLGAGSQVYTDGIIDTELGSQFDDPDQAPNPPPIAKYLRAFGNQIFYAGGSRFSPENVDRVFFSGVSGPIASPEVVPLASNFFNVPNVDDEVTGIGVSGSTLITTKNHSLWAATGNFLSGQIDIVQIAPGTNIGCVAHATISAVGTLMYFLHTNGVYAITENQLFPTDEFGNPVPISLPIDTIFRSKNFLSYTQFVFKRAVAINYTKDNQYLLFLPCEDPQATIRTANANSMLLCYDYQDKNWFSWDNMNAAGGMAVIDDDLYFQERRFSRVDGNTANLYKQHRFYRLVDHADHAGPQVCEWISSWSDLGQPEVRKKFSRCVLLMDRLSELYQYNNPQMTFSSYLNRISNLQDTIANVTQVDNIRNSSWSFSAWGWNNWSGYQDTFVPINLRRGTTAKSIQVGIKIRGINMDISLSGFQLEIIPENRKTILR